MPVSFVAWYRPLYIYTAVLRSLSGPTAAAAPASVVSSSRMFTLFLASSPPPPDEANAVAGGADNADG
jgi:hypothetical protein